MHAVLEALRMTGIMAWEILWALCLGFLLSAAIEACVSKEKVGQLLPDSSAKTIIIASALGAASSSCSYAATALARTLFRKGADFIAAIAFQFASTNLVIELSVLLAALLGWRFMAAEFIGGPIMIALVVLFLRATLTPRIDFIYSGGYQTVATPDANSYLPGYHDTNARLTYRPESNGWEAAVVGSNLANRLWYTQIFDLSNQSGADYGIPSEPRTVWVQFKKKF